MIVGNFISLIKSLLVSLLIYITSENTFPPIYFIAVYNVYNIRRIL